MKDILEAKITFINNGWEEERYILQDKVERYKDALNEIIGVSEMGYEVRKIAQEALKY